jgi:hypothetical protein
MTDSSLNAPTDTSCPTGPESPEQQIARLRSSCAEAMTKAVLQKARADALSQRIKCLEEQVELLRARASESRP